jgi:hypothetical protein
MKRFVSLLLLQIILATTAFAQVPDENWDFEDPYNEVLANLHELVNYAYDLEWELDWERRLLSDNGVRVNVGSVTSEEFLTRADIRLNQPLDEKWWFQGRFHRSQSRQRSINPDQLFLGLERSMFESSSLFLMVDPQLEKEFVDAYGGYTFYRDDREQYLRVGLLLEDLVYDSKNDLGGETTQTPVALQWALRLGTRDWWIFSEGKAGNGFKREFNEPTTELIAHDRRDNRARLRFTRSGSNENTWSIWLDWYDFAETKRFSDAQFDYEYDNEVFDFAAEHYRVLGDVHRLRFLAHYVRQRASAAGFNAHRYSRDEWLGGVFYERLWPRNGVSLAYAFGLPDANYESLTGGNPYQLDEYGDKLILGWRHRFSREAQLLISISHEVSAQGFGGGNVQFQMFL